MTEPTNAAYEKRIEIPSDCQVAQDERVLTVSGPMGELSREFLDPNVAFMVEENEVIVNTEVSRKRTRAMVGTIIAHLRNMFTGVKHGYEYEMKIVYSHFPISVEVQDDTVVIKNFIGERGNRTARVVGDVEIRTTEDEVFISGIDIEHVSQTAANIQLATKIRDKDRRIFLDGIYVIRKRRGEEVKAIV